MHVLRLKRVCNYYSLLFRMKRRKPTVSERMSERVSVIIHKKNTHRIPILPVDII